MDKSSFKPDMRYTLTLRDEQGKARPANLYVYRVYEQFMVARSTSGDGLVRKVNYSDIERIVDETAVAPGERYFLPAAGNETAVFSARLLNPCSAPGY